MDNPKLLAEESLQWIADFREGMFNVCCGKCGVGFPYLPPEFFGLVESQESLAKAYLDLLEKVGDPDRWDEVLTLLEAPQS